MIHTLLIQGTVLQVRYHTETQQCPLGEEGMFHFSYIYLLLKTKAIFPQKPLKGYPQLAAHVTAKPSLTGVIQLILVNLNF
jgi:hypothetical protein